MQAADVRAWFDDYLNVFAALGRGDLDDPRLLLEYYAVPLLLTNDDAVVGLTSENEVVDTVRGQLRGLRDSGYNRSKIITSDVDVLNANTALYAAEFARQRADDSEIGRLAATYLITLGATGTRISALVVRTR